ncbi:hypothetical protein EIP75_10640 [Aquabacterium soli]|uniref:Uncharacterized protein n=1 Tax=Aquabacterium soli TaxID=2493092 RepID=A0A3R8S324_9BURK|nr:hypothetical protein [Aquabacterium soli]RRS04342.1 hypothetical protein EIP75_10640 [Aquabacterium soli]
MNPSPILVHDLASLAALHGRVESCDELIVDARALKQYGVLRHAFKYAQWALKDGGRLLVTDEPARSLLFTAQRVDFWQVRHEFFKSVGQTFLTEAVDDARGEIRAVKQVSTTLPDGLSFGVVFGGGVHDAALLLEAVQSMATASRGHESRVEILVCGPLDEEGLDRLRRYAPGIDIAVIDGDLPAQATRIPLPEKKNRLFQAARYQAVSISHTRIAVGTDFVSRVLSQHFDVLAPRVEVEWQGRRVRYLDYILIGSYDVARRNRAKALGGFSAGENHLAMMKRRVAYVDGGIMLFDKRLVRGLPFNSDLAWSEAEDLDACGTLYQQGALIDHDASLLCESRVLKFSPVAGPVFKLTWPLKKRLIQLGWY